MKYPGVTTILNTLGKPFLVKWANKIGLQGIKVDEYVNEKAKVGELIHKIIQSRLLKQPLDVNGYSDEELRVAEKAFFRYVEWENKHIIENVEIEKELFSDTYKYMGRLDIYCKLDGLWTIIDIKTSKSINIEQEVQVSSYEQLVKENNLKVDRVMIINTGKEENSKLEIVEVPFDKISKYFKFFKALLDVYYIKKEIGWKD